MARTARNLWPIMLSVSELAAAMQVDRRAVYQMIDAGLPLYRIGTKHRMLTNEILEFIPTFFKRDGRIKQ